MKINYSPINYLPRLPPKPNYHANPSLIINATNSNHLKTQTKTNYHYYTNNKARPKSSLSQGHATPIIMSLSDTILEKMKKQSDFENYYINNVYIKNWSKWSKEEHQNDRHRFIQMSKYDSNERNKYDHTRELNEWNNEIIQMQLKEKRYWSQQRKEQRMNCIQQMNLDNSASELNERTDKSNKKQLTDYYRYEWENQIVCTWKNKLEKGDLSNRSRIKTKLLWYDYMETYQKDFNYYQDTYH